MSKCLFRNVIKLLSNALLKFLKSAVYAGFKKILIIPTRQAQTELNYFSLISVLFLPIFSLNSIFYSDLLIFCCQIVAIHLLYQN